MKKVNGQRWVRIRRIRRLDRKWFRKVRKVVKDIWDTQEVLQGILGIVGTRAYVDFRMNQFEYRWRLDRLKACKKE